MANSSDSEDTIIMPLINAEPSDLEIENILKKYDTSNTVFSNHGNFSEHEGNKLIDVIDPVTSVEVENTALEKPNSKLNKQNEIENRRALRELAKAKKLQEANLKKAMKTIEKEKKKEVQQKEKLLKNALITVTKSTKPDECMKYVEVEFDLQNMETGLGTIIKETLQKNGVSFTIKSQILTKLVTWSRRIQTIENLCLNETKIAENHFLLIMNAKEFMEYINKDNLISHIVNISSLTKFKQLTIAVIGMEKSKPTFESAITEVQILTKCYFRFFKNAEGLADFVIELTKAVAQIPYKSKKEEKYKLLSEYFGDSNKDTVRIDKNGNGLARLWQQMLTMFPLARLETAQAITTAYPTPASIFQAYANSHCKEEELLQDLPIRRAFGPCVSSRRIGPELSRKCSNFFCSPDNVFL